MGLGSVKDFTLAQARDRATLQRQSLADHIDPLLSRSAARSKHAVDVANQLSFDDACSQYIQAHASGWKSPKHAQQWQNTLATYASPLLGKLPVAEINTQLVLKVLQAIWQTKTETATRLRGRIERVLDWAKVQGLRSGSNPALWRGHLDKLLPEPRKLKQVEHHPALPWREIGEFMVQLRRQEGLSAIASELIILTACRTSEVLNARWGDFDLLDANQAIWTIPANRMKSLKQHRVPLSPSALTVLRRAWMWRKYTSGAVSQSTAAAESFGSTQRENRDDWVFPGRGNKPLSNASCLALLKRMGREDLTVHGFRSTFRDWCSEATSHSREVAEMALSHVIEGKVEGAYRRGELLEKRRSLMRDWDSYCFVKLRESAAAHELVKP